MFKKLFSVPILTPDEEKYLFSSWQRDENKESLERILAAYGRLVFSIARRYQRFGPLSYDLLQEGFIGLLKAISHFDLDRNRVFSAYARFWIRSQMQNYILNNWFIVRSPHTILNRDLFFNLNRMMIRLRNIHNDNYECHQKISELFKTTQKHIAEIHNRLQFLDTSLNQPFSLNSSKTLAHVLPDPSPNPEEILFKKREQENIRDRILQSMEFLDERESYIIYKHFFEDPKYTLDEIGESLKLTREGVRRIEKRALAKLRIHFKSQTCDYGR